MSGSESEVQGFETLLRDNEEWLTSTLLNDSRDHGFLRHLSIDEESWRESIRRLVEALVEASIRGHRSLSIEAEEVFSADPAVRFGELEGAAHRSRGVTLGFFIALMTHYRRTFERLVSERAAPASRDAFSSLITGFFDRFVIGLGEAWNAAEHDSLLEEMRALTRLATTERDLYKTILDGLNEPIMLLDETGAILTYNQAAAWTFDVPAQGWTPTDPGAATTRFEFPVLADDIRDFIVSGEGQRIIDRSLMTLQGERYFLGEFQRITDVTSMFAGITLILTDITIRRELAEASRRAQHEEYLARHDPLTGLPNRRHFEESLREACARAGRGVASTLLFVDVDNFKECNDTKGHVFGDEVLVRVGEALADQLREQDALGRLGGDEFGIVLEGADLAEAEQVIARMRERVSEVAREMSATLELSVGFAMVDRDARLEDLLAEADRQMYRDKSERR